MEEIGLRDIKYWAEEWGLPLAVLSDPAQPPFGDDFVCLSEGETVRMFLVNGRWRAEAERGYVFFGAKIDVERYRRSVEGLVAELACLNLPERVEERLGAVLEALRQFNRIYLRTEAFRLASFDQVVSGPLLDRLTALGQLRFGLRQAAEKNLFPEVGRVFEEVGRKYGLKDGQVFFYTLDELKKLTRLNRRAAEPAIESRMEGYAFLRQAGQSRLVSGRYELQALSDLLTVSVPDVVSSEGFAFGGQVASSGLVRGVVRKIRHDRSDLSSDVAAFESGCVLVTEMTRPQVLPACGRAAAIVTDEGGVACHAAIVSRELGLPCVVGTEIATRVLEDGDLVEVDALNGVIRILRRSAGSVPGSEPKEKVSEIGFRHL